MRGSSRVCNTRKAMQHYTLVTNAKVNSRGRTLRRSLAHARRPTRRVGIVEAQVPHSVSLYLASKWLFGRAARHSSCVARLNTRNRGRVERSDMTLAPVQVGHAAG
jgi:hypothetical protein